MAYGAGEPGSADLSRQSQGTSTVRTSEKGWRRLLPAVALFLLLPPTFPHLRALVPIEQTLLLLVPALAVCSWVAWRHGASAIPAAGWTVVAVWVFTRPFAGGAAYIAVALGWTLLLASAFGFVSLYRPAQGFFGRALTAIVAATAVGVIVLAMFGSTAQQVERAIAAEYADRVELSVAAWREWASQNPQAAQSMVGSVDVERALRELIPVGAALFPAILWIESIAALGLAWSLHHRLSRVRVGPPIGPLREFRFEDQFVWGIIVGLLLAIIPDSLSASAVNATALKVVGWNLLLFFGVLYALRGLGVMTWFLVRPGRWLGGVFVVACAILPPLWSLPIGIGLGDTYFDWRRRVRPPNEGAER